MVQTIFNQCPFIGGEAVIKARILLQLVNDTILYDDVTSCIQQGIYRNSFANILVQHQVEINPNPSNNSFTLIGIEEVLSMKVFDMYSNKILERNFNETQSQTKIDMQEFSNGVYTIRLIYKNRDEVTKSIILLK